MTTADDFHRLLDADPSNSEARLIFADWLEEQGDWRASGMRWMGENGKRPIFFAPLGVFSDKEPWRWCYDDSPPYENNIEIMVAGREFGGRAKSGGPYWVGFPTRREAEDALCLAYVELAAEGAS